MTDPSLVLLEVEEGMALLTINRPKALNALNEATLLRLEEAIDECGRRDDVKVVILTGAGEKAFVAGADIAEMREKGVTEGRAFSELGQRAFGKLEKLPKPVIAAVNGYALGGGTELAVSCDIVLASEKARFGQPEVNLGVFPGFGGTQRLPRLVGKARAKEIIFSGEQFDAARALAIGLINRICPPAELLNEAKELARTIMSKGMVAIGLAKQAIEAGSEVDFENGLVIERHCFAQCFDTKDLKEGMTAFLEKREPKFIGK